MPEKDAEALEAGMKYAFTVMERTAGIIALTHDGPEKEAARTEFANAFKLAVSAIFAQIMVDIPDDIEHIG